MSPMPSRGPTRGRNCYVTSAFSGVPDASAERKSEVPNSPLPSRGPRKGTRYVTPAFSVGPERQAKGTQSEVATIPMPSHGPKKEHKCNITPAFSEVPNAKRGYKIRIAYLTPASSGVQNPNPNVLHNHCIIGGSPQKGDKIRSGYLAIAFSRAKRRAELLHHACIVQGSPTPSARGE